MRSLHRTVLAASVPLVVAAAACGSAGPTAQTSAVLSHHTPQHAASHPAHHVDRVAFRQDMRKLWEDHITWTRLYIVSAVAGLPDTDATAGRLFQNQDD